MNVRRLRLALVAGAAILALTSAGVPASAQWIVYDPTNFSQNVLTAARELQQINNQIQMLTNQATSLVNQARNLANLPMSTLTQLQSSIAMARNGSILCCFLTWLFSCRKIALSLVGIPRRVSNRSVTRPPTAWANSRTSSPTRRVFRADG